MCWKVTELTVSLLDELFTSHMMYHLSSTTYSGLLKRPYDQCSQLVCKICSSRWKQSLSVLSQS